MDCIAILILFEKKLKNCGFFGEKGAFEGNIRIIIGTFPKSGYGAPNPRILAKFRVNT
jgi:hypothetical protein